MIFPLFLFIAGISFPFSLQKRKAMNCSQQSIYAHVIYRGLILVLLGILYNEGLKFNFHGIRYSSVLGRIGLAWMFAAIIFMNTKLSFRIIWFWALIIGYWLLLLAFPGDHMDAFSREGNLAGILDRMILPGRLSFGDYEPQGLLTTIPSIGIPLMGMLTGEFMLSKYLDNSLLKKLLHLIIAGIGFVVLGLLWNIIFPINKNLWSSSFICLVCGLSLLFFSLFYLVIDIWQYKKWAFFFIVIGMNPITIYMGEKIINFKSATQFFFGGMADLFPQNWAPLIIDGIGLTAIAWIFLYFLYKKKIFLKL
jgi:predicted acyltransferase